MSSRMWVLIICDSVTLYWYKEKIMENLKVCLSRVWCDSKIIKRKRIAEMCKGGALDGEEKANYEKIGDCRILDTRLLK